MRIPKELINSFTEELEKSIKIQLEISTTGLRNQIDAQAKRANEAEAREQTAAGELESARQIISDYTDTIDKIRAERDGAETDLTAAKNHLATMAEEIKTLTEEKDAAGKVIDALIKTISKQENEIDKRDEDAEELEDWRERRIETEAAAQEIRELQNEIRHNMETAATAIETAQNERDAARQEATELQSSLTEIAAIATQRAEDLNTAARNYGELHNLLAQVRERAAEDSEYNIKRMNIINEAHNVIEAAEAKAGITFNDDESGIIERIKNYIAYAEELREAIDHA